MEVLAGALDWFAGLSSAVITMIGIFIVALVLARLGVCRIASCCRPGFGCDRGYVDHDWYVCKCDVARTLHRS